SLMKDQIYYKILDFGKIIGGFIVKPEGKGQYELYRLFIDPEYQGKGIGSRTLTYIEKELIDAVKIVLETPSFNIKNHVFYEKMGYIKTGEVKYAEDCYSYKYEKLLK
ncbi:MAG: GNAT family N-acetyltransferase, partial [Bacillota bacterium]|nr:GNAT family N-acetyltransferase [Bacillota bacterium]